ncbi:DUF3747 domain-containing protein [Cyanobium sp. NIES-981]|uniref:DUF3747 domain-containing protein n=1 Tax=Cyanobium sp. NIES-981 TaxID=1851505 RepID=UPI0007DD49D2|nr:DUF3747 domain-containing protein [Cyanobium sp. NIES-981]SBO44691.1 conserved protein of unknown function [Cyanobium sp. NIES-981]
MTNVLARAVMEFSALHPLQARRATGTLATRRARRCSLALLSLLALGAAAQPAAASGLFEASDLKPQSFLLVAAPIGNGERAQLNIYEQIRDTRPCFAVNGAQPGQVDPLLSTFDFTGICGRFLDANGYSVRVGATDLGSSYRLSVVRSQNDNLLLAVPTKPGAGPEMIVARTQGPGSGFLQLVFESGWQLKRRAYQGRTLGHLYLYRDTWPDQLAGQPGPGPAAPPAVSDSSGS